MEYAKFGEGFVCRESADQEWMDCQISDIPIEILDEWAEAETRRQQTGEGPVSGTGDVTAE